MHWRSEGMAESQEYNILKRYIPEFRTAVKSNLTSLGGRFISSNLISPENDDKLRNQSKSEEDRAAELVSLLLDKVKLNKENYRKIVDILKTSGDHFNDLLSKLESAEAQQESRRVGYSQQTTFTFQASASAISDYRVPIRALGMTCGCDICISGLGCPKPLPSEIKFPLLDKRFGSLDDQEKEEFLFELKRDTVQIMKKFYRLASELYNSINRGPRPVTVHDLRANLYEIKVYLDRRSKESIFDCYKEEFDRAQKIEEIFNVITETCSFLDYDLLENLTNAFGTQEDKERIAKYRKDFVDYARRRTSIFECPCIEPADYTKWSDIYVKLDSKLEATFNIERLREFRHQISEILRINKAAIRFCCAQKGCIELKFQLPKFIEKVVIVPPFFERKTQLKQLGVIQFSTNDYRCNIKINPNVVCDPEALQISHRLKTHHREITSAINFVELETYLASKGFLKDGEEDYFVTELSQEEGVELILARVKERGDEGFKDFLWCLEQDNDWHIGHVYVAALLRGDTFTDETQREIEHSIKLRQKYRKQLDVMRIMEDSINTYDLIPSLRARKLLTDDETEELTLPQYGRRERITKLLSILNTKGPLADLYFTQALTDTVGENPVHRDILERVYCQNFEEIMGLKRDSASTNSVSLGKRRRSLIIKPYAPKVRTSYPRQVRAHGIILSEGYINRIKDVTRHHIVGDWDGAERIVEKCRLLVSMSKKRGELDDDVSPTKHLELYIAVALRNCSGYVIRIMNEKLLSIVSEAKELCKQIDNDNGRVLESRCEWMLAKMYRYSKDFDKAMEHIENAQLIHLRFNIAPGEDTTLCNYSKGCILMSQLAKTKQWNESSKKFEEAKLCLRRATEHAAIQDFAIYQSHHMIRLAQLCLHSSQFEAGSCKDDDQITEAEAALNSHYIDEKLLAPRTKCLFYVTRSDLYRNKGQLTLAREEAQRAKDIATKNKFDTEIKSAEVRLAALKLTTTVHSY